MKCSPAKITSFTKTQFSSIFIWCFHFTNRVPAKTNQPSETPTFTLFYFNVKALAEPIRFLLAYGNQEYEDVRVTRDEWPTLKPST